MEINKIIPIHFDEWQKTQYIRDALTQWDRNMQLEISGLDISDETVEVHFSLEEISGGAKRNLGTVENGVISVKVPAFILEGPEYVHGDSYCAWAWVYVSDKESSETIRKIYFTIEARPKPEEYETPEELSFLQQLENEIKKKVNSSGHEPNKYLGTDESGNVVTKDQEEFRLEVAGEEKLGGVKPVTKSDSMTQEVGVDKQGKLYTEPSSIDEETLLKLAIKQTTEKAAFHNIQNSAAYRVLDFGMEGKTEQESSPGNQLFDISKFKSGLYVTNNGDGSITLTRYAVEGSNYISEVLPTVVAGQTIVFSATNPGSFIYFGGVVKKFGSSFEVTQEMLDSNLFGFYGISDVTTADNPLTISDIMINEGTTALPYEPYTNGPTPNPDYPQEIVNAGVYNEETGRYEHKCCVGNKNIMSPFIYDGGLNYDNGSFNAATTTPTRKTTDFIYFDITKTYYLSIGARSIAIFGYDVNKEFVARTPSTVSSSKLFTKDNLSVALQDGKTRDDIVYIRCMVYLVDGYYDEQIQLELGSTGTPCTPHASQQFTLTSDRPLTMWDKLVKVDGVWGWSVNSIKNTITDISKYNVYGGILGTDRCRFFVEGIDNFNEGEIMSDIAFPSNSGTSETSHISIHPSSTNRLAILCPLTYIDYVEGDSDGTVVQKFKDKALSKEFTILYQTAEEQAFIPLPAEEQTLLHNLETYYGVTNVYNEQGCPMRFKYCADQELHWNQKLLQIQQAII